MARRGKKNGKGNGDDSPPEMGGNITDLKKQIKDGATKVIALKEQRSAINEDIASIRADLAALGIPRKDFDGAVKRYLMDPKDRTTSDEATAICCEALGVPVQGNLFGDGAPTPPAGDDTQAGAQA